MCTFAVQTVVCGYINGGASDPISITFDASEQPTPTLLSNYSPTDNPESYSVDPTENTNLYPTENQGTYNLETVNMNSLNINIDYIISIGLLATALMVCVVMFITIIVIKSKVKSEAALQQSASPGETIHVEPMYEDITGTLPLESAIDTQDNVAYGHGHTQMTTVR